MQVAKLLSKRKEKTAADLMQKEAPSVGKGTTIMDAGRLLFSRSLRHLIVIDEKQSPVGVISLRDILVICNQFTSDDTERTTFVRSTPVSQLITAKPLTVRADACVSEIVQSLHVVGCVPVVNEADELVGVVELADAAKYALLGSEQQAEGEFKFFQPGTAASRRNIPAYIRRSTGSLVLPVEALGEQADKWSYARLGYDAAGDRIVVQLLQHAAQDAQKMKHARLHDGNYIIIDANAFVDHFKIDFEGRPYQIAPGDGTLILTPRR